MAAAPRAVLVAEDDAAVRDLVVFALAREGLVVLPAADGAEALSLVRHRRPDLVLLDVLMPDPDGVEVCRRLKADPATATTPVVILTAEVQPVLRERALAAGADAYLTKPFSPAELVAVVRRLLPP